MEATRPDLSISVNVCSRYQNKPSQAMRKSCKRILRYIQSTLELFYNKPSNDSQLVWFADSDWAGIEERKYIYLNIYVYLYILNILYIYINIYLNIYGPVLRWSTKKHTTVAVLSTDVEYIVLPEATKEELRLMQVLKLLDVDLSSFKIFVENLFCITLTSALRVQAFDARICQD